jgi:hypothetical protein
MRSNVLGLSCPSKMPPLGREVQAERYSSLQAYRDRSNPGLERATQGFRTTTTPVTESRIQK